ncbi:putative F-box domain-containing protein [Medicago truncatula]|uniref:F-box SKIP23-like protein, putative n=1 Tax=Medicago truncatula TaxID=3880 RepID=G7IXX3_MEDTR|nr:F-box protein SKIP23 [Medicago truncatula]AES70101.2 F-box SKIP23-like protein, putative [Medicago truncatula]RHN66864.1 putative F-box domain-containing protein [Medicago truncatula]
MVRLVSNSFIQVLVSILDKLKIKKKAKKPDWSQLAKELLQLISERLDSELYRLRFRSVCSSWRSSSSPNYHQNHLPLKLPEFSNIENNYLIKHNMFLIKSPTNSIPWLIRVGPKLNGKTHLWDPRDIYYTLPFYLQIHLNLALDLNKLSIIDLGHVFYIHDSGPGSYVYPRKVIGVGEQPLAIVTCEYSGELIIFRCGDDHWTNMPDVPNVEKSHGDICNFKGRPCVIDRTGRTMMIESDLTVHLAAEPCFGGDTKFLVESKCRLLHVDRYESDGSSGNVRIDVFGLDEKEKNWVKLPNLGEGCSFSASASDLGVANGNCVIFCAGDMSVFHLDQGRISPLSDYPDYVNLFLWPPPKWISDAIKKYVILQ